MADLIKVNTSRLKSDASDIKGHIKGIKKELLDLKNHRSALDAMWDGEGSEAFKAAFSADITALEQAIKTIEALNGYEDNARKKYDECENQVGDLVNQVKVR